jgi:predicted nucleic acid-binding protein
VIFVDTSFWIATNLPRDAHHTDAQRLLHLHRMQQLTTTNHVLGETWTFIQRRASHADAVAFLDRALASPRLSIVHVSRKLEDVALAWLRRHDERRYSFVDATSFALMRSLKIKDALVFDTDFSAAGFRELRPWSPGHHSVQAPAVGDALQLVLAGILEHEAGARDQVPHGRGDPHIEGLCELHDG